MEISIGFSIILIKLENNYYRIVNIIHFYRFCNLKDI